MNDDELPINAERASAYLDGELDAAERASAAADPDVVAVIESFAQVRAALGEISPVVDSTRTSAIAAALAEYDALHVRGAATATVTSLQSRRLRVHRVMTGVAAAAVIGVVAIAALNSTRGGDTNSSSSATAAPAAVLPAETPQLKATAATAAAAGTVAPAGGDAGSSTVQVPAIDTADGLRQYAASFGLAAAAAPAATEAPAASTPAASDASTEAAALACLTSGQVVIGPIFFQGTSALAVRETSNGHVQAVDAIDCRVLLDVIP